MSVARSVSVGPGTSMSVDFDDRDREITAAAMLELADSTLTSVGARSSRIPSLAPNVGPTSLGDIASGGFPLTALGRYTDPDDSFAQDRYWTRVSLIVDVPSGYPEDLGTFGTPDTLDIEDVLSINVSPLSAISTSGIDDTPCPDAYFHFIPGQITFA